MSDEVQPSAQRVYDIKVRQAITALTFQPNTTFILDGQILHHPSLEVCSSQRMMQVPLEVKRRVYAGEITFEVTKIWHAESRRMFFVRFSAENDQDAFYDVAFTEQVVKSATYSNVE